MCVTHLEVIFASIGKREVGEQEWIDARETPRAQLTENALSPNETLETYFRRIAYEMGLEVPYLGVLAFENEEITQ